ncbi:MAG: AMP-binding protein [Scytonema sp. CRU_2_7]|nr:AMP-binding protein [Scytonema sp. CRU_2_7]
MGKNLFEQPARFSTLVEILQGRAFHQPKQKAYSFLLDSEEEESHITYGDLDFQAREIAALLQSCGVVSGERVLLLYPPGLEFIAAFFGCLYAGVVAVPAYPPRANQSLSRLQAIVADAQAVVALTTTTVLSKIERQFAQYPNLQILRFLATDNIIASKLVNTWQEPSVNSNTLAFLQYTSGSTGSPKGVMVSHGNLLHNELLIQQAMQHSTETLFVGWLPLFHDMGLVGNMLQPLYLGIPCILMSPVAFLQKPLRWLQAISRYKATTSGGPNFAYDLCVSKITPEQRATLDLSSWEVAFNGAEPVRAQTLERFATTFEACGFRREAFYPCYGMAETTLIVSGGFKAAPPVVLSVQQAALAQNQVVTAPSEEVGAHQTLVSCGQPLQDLQIVIVHPETGTRCGSHEVGEIWVKGPSVAVGYWNQTEQTEETFRAYLTDSGEGPFLRTGDLGFLHSGELFITGRLKDLIVIRGRNHYPQDIEWTLEQSHPALQKSGSAAFSIEVAGVERLVVADEVKRTSLRNLDIDEVIKAIRQAVVEEYELQVYAVLLLKTGSIPKTSSGKIQRYACRAGFLNGSLNIVGSSILEESYTSGSEVTLTREDLRALKPQERHLKLTFYLQELLAKVLKVAPSPLDFQQPLSTMGLDSLMAIELKNAIETNFGVVLPITSFFAGSNIDQLASEVLAQDTVSTFAQEMTLAPASEAVAENSLSHGQQALYFLHQLTPESPAYNIVAAAHLQGELDIAALRNAFQSLVERHPALRTTFTNLSGQPVQEIHEHLEICFEHENVSTWSEAFLNNRLVEEAHRPFNLEQGPLLRVSLFTRWSQGEPLKGRSPKGRRLKAYRHKNTLYSWLCITLSPTSGLVQC